MPFLSFDLDGKKKTARVARAVGVEPGVVAWGLLELWEHAWGAKSDIVGEMVLDGCFGPSERMRAALVAYDFLEKIEGGWRVRGAAKYLGISASRVAAGKSSAGRARGPDGRLLSSKPPASAGEPSSKPPANDQLLHPVTQHPTPNTQSPTFVADRRNPESPGAALRPVEPFELKPETAAPKARKRSDGQRLWDWSQVERSKHTGLVREDEPKAVALNAFYSTAIGELKTEERICLSFARYLLKPKDSYWRERGFPFNGFMAKWREYAPPVEEPAGVAA